MVAQATDFGPAFDVDTTTFEIFLDRVRDETTDFKLGLLEIARLVYKDNKKIFTLVGPGKWPDLADSTKKQKQKQVGFTYPLFRWTGKLEKSITSSNAPGSVKIVSKKTIFIGTSVRSERGFPYPVALQFGTRKMPARPFLFIDEVRAKRYTQTIDNFLKGAYKRQGWIK